MRTAAAFAAAPAFTASAPQGPACFALRGGHALRAPCPAPALRLADGAEAALAELLPLLLCGEESAVLAFGASDVRHSLDSAARNELEKIRCEEVVHGLLLQRLQAGLPPASLDAGLRARMRRFFITLADADPGRYFARIAGLDSAVCVLLGALRGRRSALAGAPTVAATFACIHRDEAGHVRAARGIALAFATPARARDVATETRARLVTLLAERGAAFETLGIDADRLFLRLGEVSRGIFS
jgi:hypothetical protein